jgi:hypothetical protein
VVVLRREGYYSFNEGLWPCVAYVRPAFATATGNSTSRSTRFADVIAKEAGGAEPVVLIGISISRYCHD